MGMKPIAWAPGYLVSDGGRVFSTLRADRLGARAGELHELRGGVGGNGYPMVGLAVNGRTIARTIHSLVAEAFLGPRPPWHQEIRHLDGDKLNCAASNLAWGTRSENQIDSNRHGTRAHQKLTEDDVRRIRSSDARGVDLAREYGVTKTLITSIRKRRAWKHVA